jgi:hypothetical protein
VNRGLVIRKPAWLACDHAWRMAETIWSIIAALGGFGMIGVVTYFMLNDRGDREAEEDARDYLDEHGHWPGEPAVAPVGRPDEAPEPAPSRSEPGPAPHSPRV